ncbi:DUF29 family protein [Lamprobacter modestohalophilus]|uniref:DUF29 family protein n=1 Tax=Lamprobacter modestohalophilus TaxID=1064514 RepID=UPI003D189822
MHSLLRETDDTTAAYDADDFLWLQATRGQLARRDFAGVDLIHLLEEIDDLSRREQRTLKHLLRQLLAHLLKLEYWSAEEPRSGNHWRATDSSRCSNSCARPNPSTRCWPPFCPICLSGRRPRTLARTSPARLWSNPTGPTARIRAPPVSRRFSILAARTLSGSDPRGDPHHAR